MTKKEEKTKGIFTVIVVGVLFYGYALLCYIKPDRPVSESERRALSQRPAISMEALVGGKYQDEFESAAQDQAPFRQVLRGTKVSYQSIIMRRLDNNGMYLSNGYISRIDYPFNEKSVDYATDRFRYIYDNYLDGTNVSIYVSIIPDKNYYNEKLLYPTYDYSKLVVRVRENMEYGTYVDLMNQFEMKDYYRTDTHLRQEALVDACKFMAEKMNVTIDTEYNEILVSEDFKGVYYRQLGIPMKGEDMYYLSNSTLDKCRVYDYENSKEISMYDLSALEGADPYEMYLYGTLSLVTIDNPIATTKKELVIFRDSFASSFAPILATGYRRVTLVDIRYLTSDKVGQFIDFDKQDVLFMYSAGLLNNSETLK